MKQHEAVIEVMRKNGGFSTLGHLYREVLKVPGVEWKTKTPFASMRRIVQDPRFFFKIRPGLWALNECRGRLPSEVLGKSRSEKESSSHTYYQGLLVEIGNLVPYGTTVPNQDRNRIFLNRPLGDVTTLQGIRPFSYDGFVRCAASVDVVWFNDREMPAQLFEVEHTTDIKNSLLKFVELQDFHADFHIVADTVRKRDFDGKMELAAFRPLRQRVSFLDYETVSVWHAKSSALAALRRR